MKRPFLLVVGLLLAVPALRAQDSGCRTFVPDSSTSGSIVVAPRYRRGPVPQYPAGFLNKSLPGSASLQFVVNCSGRVDSASVVVLGATDSLFAAPAVASTLGSEFAPATVDGKRVAMRIEQRISFKTTIGSMGGRPLPWWTPQCPPGGCGRP